MGEASNMNFKVWKKIGLVSCYACMISTILLLISVLFEKPVLALVSAISMGVLLNLSIFSLGHALKLKGESNA